MGKNHFQFSLFLKDNTAEESHKSCMQLQFFVSLCISLSLAWHGSSIGEGGGGEVRVVHLGFSRAYPAIGKKTKNLPKPNKMYSMSYDCLHTKN